MRAARFWALSVSISVGRLVIGCLAVLGTSQGSFTANAQTCPVAASPQAPAPKVVPMPKAPANPPPPPYVCDTQCLTLKLKAIRDPVTGATGIGKWSLSPQSIKVKVKVQVNNLPPGTQPADAILVVLYVTFEGLEGGVPAHE